MTRAIIGFVIVCLSLVPVTAASQPQAMQDSLLMGPPDTALVVATVTYVVGSTVYFDAGREQGLTSGLQGTLLRGGTVLGAVVVLDLSSRRGTASVDTGMAPQAGDKVRFPVVVTAMARRIDTAAPPLAAAAAEKPFMSRMGIRGRAGIRFLAVQDQDGGSHFNQPAADLALELRQPGGAPLRFFVDARARRTYLSEGADESRTRVYRLEGLWDASSRVHIALGRLAAPQFPSVGLVDGGRAEVGLDPVTLGAFFGTQPEPDTYDLSNEVMQYGVYSRAVGKVGESGRWGGVLGWASSTASGEPNRNFFYLAGDLGTGRLQLHGNQDVDLNRGWKADLEGESITFTNTYVSGSYRITRPWAVRASFDNRRNVLLYADRETPESEFDRSYRQGFQVGTEWRGRWTVDVSYRSSRGVEGDARSGTLAVRVPRFPARAFDLTARGTRYTGPDIDGWLGAMGVLWHATTQLDVSAHGGLRAEDRSFGLGTEETIHWFGADCDLSVLSNWYVNLSAELTRGTAEHTDQIYSRFLTYRRRSDQSFTKLLRQYAIRSRIHVETLIAQEADQRQSELPRRVHGQARRGSHRRQDRDPGQDRFLHQLEAGSPAHPENMLEGGELVLQKQCAHDLVNRVVPSNILVQR